MKKIINWALSPIAICPTTCNFIGWMLVILIHVFCPEQISYPGYYYAVGLISFLTLSEIIVYILAQKKENKEHEEAADDRSEN